MLLHQHLHSPVQSLFFRESRTGDVEATSIDLRPVLIEGSKVEMDPTRNQALSEGIGLSERLDSAQEKIVDRRKGIGFLEGRDISLIRPIKIALLAKRRRAIVLYENDVWSSVVEADE